MGERTGLPTSLVAMNPVEHAGSGAWSTHANVRRERGRSYARMLGNSALSAVKKSFQRYVYLFRNAMVSHDAIHPRVRCDSDGTHVEGALLMKSYGMSE